MSWADIDMVSPPADADVEEERRQHRAEVESYKARIAYLEGKLAALGVLEDGSSNNDSDVYVEDFLHLPGAVQGGFNEAAAPSFEPQEADRKGKQPMTTSQVQKYEERVAALSIEDCDLQREIALDCANVADQFVYALAAQNEELERRLAVLRDHDLGYINIELRETVDVLQADLEEANRRCLEYDAMKRNYKEMKRAYKKMRTCLVDRAKEHENLRLATVLAVARARQYEAEFKSLKKEWAENDRLRVLQLTSWPFITEMFKEEWEGLKDPSGSINWGFISDEDHGWDKYQRKEYPFSEAGVLEWPNPAPFLSDGSVCALCMNPFGPEGGYQVGTCGAYFHPSCLIEIMIRRRRCPHCRSAFHPRLYLMFGLRDFMPSHWVYSPYDFGFPLGEYDGQEVEWSWQFQCSKLQLYHEHKDGMWQLDPKMVTYVADELYPNKPPNYGMKMFLYQALGWHWNAQKSTIELGTRPPFYASSGELAASTEDIHMYREDVPERDATEDYELIWEESYYTNRLVYSAVDAIRHKIAPELKSWLEGGQFPKRHYELTPSNVAYRTRHNLRRVEARQNGS